MSIVGSSPPSPPSPFSNSTRYCLLWQTGQLRSKRLSPMPLTFCRSCIILSLPTPTLDPLRDMMTGNLLYPNPLYPTINSAQQQSYPTHYYDGSTRLSHPSTQYLPPPQPLTPHGASPQPQLPPPPGLGFSPYRHYPMANVMYPYPPAPAPTPAPVSSDKAGTRHRRKQRKQGNKTPPKEKTGALNTTLPRTSLLCPSKLHFYWHHHGWVTTHGWPSGHGGHHGDSCMFMKSRPSEFTPAMLAART
jgi:hypothetical protein